MRKIRSFLSGYCYHATVRCNNRDFLLTRYHCREVLLFGIEQCKAKYDFKLYGICIMSNHVHYLLKPEVPKEMPKIMHFLNWYSAMCLRGCLKKALGSNQ